MFRQLSDPCWLIKPMGRVYRRTCLFTSYWLIAYNYSTHGPTLQLQLQKSHFHVLNQNSILSVMRYSTYINNFLNYTDSMYIYLLLELFEWADVNVCLGFTCTAHNLRKKQHKANTTAIKTHHNKITLPFPHPSIQISQYKNQERNGAIKNSCYDFQRSVMGEKLRVAIFLSLFVGLWGGGMQTLVVGFYSGQYLRRNAGLCSATVCSW